MAIENKIEAFGTQFEDAYHVIKSIKWWKHDVEIHPPNIEPDNTVCDVEMYSYASKEACLLFGVLETAVDQLLIFLCTCLLARSPAKELGLARHGACEL